MTPITKLSLVILFGASLAACSEQSEVPTDTTAKSAEVAVSVEPTVVPTEAPVAKEATPEAATDSHEGHAHNEATELTSAAIATANDPFQQDVHYRVLETAIPADTNQVHEFFWYGCPACKATEPLMNTLKANEKLKVTANASLLNEKWVFDAVIFQAFKHFGVLEKAHPAYFEARQNGTVKDQASFEAFLAEQGIDKDKFEAFSQSEELKNALDASFAVESKLQSTGVPTLVVGGKYVLLNRGFSSVGEMEKAIEWLSTK
ncbi:thiol:disulfide interchange protein DsbA/DsbL [Motilimonas sp. 1_MG-2023]|uniref:thiol:disulfide interchange protein DsbA/DsbL n=1 Tax=Motilimonas TaxID=1914248 RepID=UPI0026E3B05B|nr:thiol:disulfide interchange protein DsbA/DsbL [Motilimonas sp. 1_MG-2023]MDO6524250.1 thiol:disulfide interchange protein DsbA/DsbL [Motilimonas sp. 1_MG-2023]